MKKLLLAVSTLLLFSCKSNKDTVKDEHSRDTAGDSLFVAPMPGSDDPQKYDSLKRELDKRRKR
jgi:hypothetical protein